MHGASLRFVARRVASALLLVALVSSAAVWLTALAPGDPLSDFQGDAAYVAAERRRLGLDAPPAARVAAWAGRAARLDLGESVRYQRPVRDLLRERAPRTTLLGAAALALATAIGLPLGIYTGSRRRGALPALARGSSVLFLSIPPLLTSIALLLVAARTGWLPVGGLAPAPADAGLLERAAVTLRYLALPALALALPVAAALERLQAEAIREALDDPAILAARARGVPSGRVTRRHALKLSLKPVLAIYGVMVGTLLSGSFAVEIVTGWPGLGELTYQALVARDLYLVAGCAAAGSVLLAAGVLFSDLALALVDPRVAEAA